MERADLIDRLERLRTEIDGLIDELSGDEERQATPIMDEFTRQIVESLTPKFEELFRKAIETDQPVSLDSVTFPGR